MDKKTTATDSVTDTR